MKKAFTLLFVLAVTGFCFSQSQIHKTWWYMGNLSGCQFTGGSPVGVNNGLVNVNEGSIVMSHSVTGALLFYTEGMNVWNATGALMTNGTGLMGDPSSTQSGMVCPRPGFANQYYIFTVWPGSGLRYSIVDMTLSGGLGAVTAVKNVLVGGTNVDEKLTGCLMPNQTDYWILVHMGSTNQFCAYPVTAAGVGASVNSNTGPVYNGAIGYMNVNSCGTKIGLSNYNPAMGLCDFNNSTGVVSNYIDISFGSNYSSGFSPDGTRFYHWSYTPTNAVYQVDATLGTQAAINASRVLITTQPNWFGAFVYGRDGKLYSPSYGTPNMHVFSSPNALGLACGFNANAVNVFGNSQLGLPNFIEISACQILPMDLVSFTGECVNGKAEINWATVNEIHIERYEIQKSLNGKDWDLAGTVKPNALSKGENKYSFEDPATSVGVTYYRLKEIDQNGLEKIIDPVVVTCIRRSEIEIFPNPCSGTFNLRGIDGENEVTIRDISNRLVFSEQNVVDIYQFDLTKFGAGIYFMQIDIRGQEKIMKKILVK
jgi:hypothetical protein